MLKTNLGKAETDPVGSARVPHAVPWPREGTNDEGYERQRKSWVTGK